MKQGGLRHLAHGAGRRVSTVVIYTVLVIISFYTLTLFFGSFPRLL